MLARLAELPLNHSILIDQSPDNKKRSHLAHERNLLSAKRTIAACYRTIYSRARIKPSIKPATSILLPFFITPSLS